MAAGTYNLCIDQGATFSRVFLWTVGGCTCGTGYCSGTCGCSSSSCAGGTPVDLTGFTADMQIRQTVQSSTILYEASTSNGDIVLGGTAGTITLTIPASATAGFTWNLGVYDMNLTSSGGIVTRLIQGAVTVSPEVTR
jgi:hypothetical protein